MWREKAFAQTMNTMIEYWNEQFKTNSTFSHELFLYITFNKNKVLVYFAVTKTLPQSNFPNDSVKTNSCF